MYAQVKYANLTNFIGQVVWAEISKDEFDNTSGDEKIIVLYPSGKRGQLYKKALEYLSDEEADAHALAAQKRMEAIQTVENSKLVIMFHNYDDIGYGWWHGMKQFSHPAVADAAKWLENAFCRAPSTYPNYNASTIGAYCMDEKIPILHVGRMRETSYLYWWVSTPDNAFLESGMLSSPERIDFFRVLDDALKALVEIEMQ